MLQTLRSHDQYNTTIYGQDDRYRGIYNGRRVVMVNEKDIHELGFAENDLVDLVSEWADPDGSIEERRAEEFRIVAYNTPQGNAAAYYPETNVLVPLDSVADVSGPRRRRQSSCVSRSADEDGEAVGSASGSPGQLYIGANPPRGEDAIGGADARRRETPKVP